MNKLYYLILGLGLMVAATGCNKCKDVSCANGGTCEDGTCNCLAGFSGENCETEDKCVTNNVSCLNGGECVDGVCDCAPYYYGASCNVHCVNGSVDGTACDCDAGFEGTACETYSRDKFFGTYLFLSGCATGTHSSTIKAHDDEEHPEWVSITNISADGDSKGYAEISGDTLWIPKQTVTGTSGGKWVVESTAPAFLSSGTISIAITRKVASASGSGVPCTHEFELQ